MGSGGAVVAATVAAEFIGVCVMRHMGKISEAVVAKLTSIFEASKVHKEHLELSEDMVNLWTEMVEYTDFEMEAAQDGEQLASELLKEGKGKHKHWTNLIKVDGAFSIELLDRHMSDEAGAYQSLPDMKEMSQSIKDFETLLTAANSMQEKLS